MECQQHEDQAIHCLAKYGYIVARDGQGYVVCHLHHPDDVSRMRHLADLVDFAELVEWANQRRQQSRPEGS